MKLMKRGSRKKENTRDLGWFELKCLHPPLVSDFWATSFFYCIGLKIEFHCVVFIEKLRYDK
jgi:hypothetical protein